MRAVAAFLLLVLVAGCAQPPPPEPATVTTETSGVAAAPQASFSWEPKQPRVGEEVLFLPHAKVAKGSNVTSWQWSLGDGVTSASATVRHAFTVAGNRTVELKVTDSGGRVGTASAVVQVRAALPSAAPPANRTDPEIPAPVAQGPELAPDVAELRDRILAAMASGSGVSVESFAVDTFLGFDSRGDASSFRLVLKPGLALASDFWAEVDGAAVARPFVEVYEGHVEGQPDQLARLTLASDWARGSVRVGDREHLIRINMKGNVPEGTRAALSAPLGVPPPPPKLVDGASWSDDEQCTGGLSEWAPLTITPVTGVGRSTLAPIVATVILDADARMAEQLGDHTMPMMAAILNEMDMVYDYEVGVRLRAIGLHQNTDAAYYPDPEQTAPLDRLEEYWAQRHRGERDLVHLFTGYPSGYAQANCIGGAGSPAGLSFSPIGWERDYTVFHTHAFAHEFGHLFAAHHHYGNHAESELATIMIQGYTPGAQPVFGTLERSVIRGWAERMLG